MMTQTLHKTYRLAVAMAVVAVLTPVSPVSAQVTYTTRALSGDQAPGTEPGVVFRDFNAPVLNNAGQIAFFGRLSNAPFIKASGIWSGDAGSLSLVAREGDAAPGTEPGAVFNGPPGSPSFGNPVLNDAGQIAFEAALEWRVPVIGPSNDTGIWSGNTGSLRVVRREGDAAPGTEPGAVFTGSFGNPVLNDAGQTAFVDNLTGTGVNSSNSTGIWSEGSGSLSLVARQGNLAPGTTGVVFGSSAISRTFDDPVLNDAGQTAFLGTLAGTGVNTTNDNGIWSEGSGSLSLVAREGNAAPGTSPGVVFDVLDTPVLNNAGQTAFKGTLTGTGVISGVNSRGIWAGETGSLSLVARQGDAAPGTEPGAVFGGTFVGDIVLNGAGQIAFVGQLDGTSSPGTRTGIWLGGAGSLSLVVRAGDAAPGTEPPGVVFSHHLTLGNKNLLLNGVGQIAFVGFLTGAGLGGTNDSGIWATDLNGVLKLIVREGDLFDVNDDPQVDDLRVISDFSLFGGPAGADDRATSFNDAGQIAFQLSFTGGSSGIFVALVAPASGQVDPVDPPTGDMDDGDGNGAGDTAPTMGDCGDGLCGAGGMMMMPLTLFGIGWMKRPRRIVTRKSPMN